MLSKSSFAGAAALLLAPLVVIPAVLVRPTLSDDAANQVAALTDHRQAVITGNALTSIAIVLLIAGIVWLALMLAPRAPRLARGRVHERCRGRRARHRQRTRPGARDGDA
jgi:hypothetical protein